MPPSPPQVSRTVALGSGGGLDMMTLGASAACGVALHLTLLAVNATMVVKVILSLSPSTQTQLT